MFISIEIDLEHLKDTVERRIWIVENKTLAKGLPGKSNLSKSDLYHFFTFFEVWVWIFDDKSTCMLLLYR